MSLNLEVEVDVPFTFDYEALAGELSLLPSTMKVFLMRRK